jgi:Methyltransferase domain
MNRRIEPEWLDGLPADHPDANGSRRDLQRLNRWMGNVGLMVRRIAPALESPECSLLELGGGDGSFLLKVLKRIPPPGNHACAVTLLDRQDVVPTETRRAFARLGWKFNLLQGDVLGWASDPAQNHSPVIIANLFLHHFESTPLRAILKAIAERARVFIAIEPRRSAAALGFSRMVGFIGCNHVTRHDAPASVRAGFAGRELSELWPQRHSWVIQESPANLFSHIFVAYKT